MASDEKAGEQQPSGGGIGGLLAKRLVKKKDNQLSGDKARSTFMTTSHEVLSVATDVDASAVAMPAGVRQK